MARQPLSLKSQLDPNAASLFQTGMRTTHPSIFSPFLVTAYNDNTTTTSLFSDHHKDEYGCVLDDSSDADTGVCDILGGLPLPPQHQHQNHANDNSLLSSMDIR